jgi:hypothetical protein
LHTSCTLVALELCNSDEDEGKSMSLISNYFATETFSIRGCPCTWQTTHEWYYSIFLRCFCLQKLLIRYTLDVMHCEMNLAKNFLKTISGIKDTIKVRRDMQRRNIRRHLWLTAHNKRGGQTYETTGIICVDTSEV